MQTLARRGVGDAAAGLGLHFLHMSEGPFSHDAGHLKKWRYLKVKVAKQISGEVGAILDSWTFRKVMVKE